MPHEFRGSREPYHYNLRVVWVGIRGEIDALVAGIRRALEVFH